MIEDAVEILKPRVDATEDTDVEFDFEHADEEFLVHVLKGNTRERYCDGAHTSQRHPCPVLWYEDERIMAFCPGCGAKLCPPCVAKRNWIKGFR